MSDPSRPSPPGAFRRPEFLFFGLLAIGAGALFFLWLPPPLREAEQLANTAILLGLLAFYLVFDFRPRLADPSARNRKPWAWAAAGTILAGGALLAPEGLARTIPVLGGLACFLRATGGALLDRSSDRLLDSLFVAFALFGALLVALPFLDMPLRILAGKWSAHIFEWFRQETELGFVVREGVPMLLLVVNGRPFHVAAECNGFGLLGTCLILTVAFVAYRRVPWLDAILLLVAAAFLAVVGNLLRIFVIVLLAPHVGDHYFVMHEIVGTIVFYAFLALQWWLTVGFGRSPRPARTA